MAANSRITVLRVKRKASEDPQQLIRIEYPQKKKAKTDEETVGKEYFQLQLLESSVAEVSDNCILEQVEQKLTFDEAISTDDRLEMKKSQPTIQEEKVLMFDSSKIVPKSSHIKSWKTSKNKKKNETDDDILVEIFDVAKDAEQVVEMESICKENDTSEIICNSIKMIRENLKISDTATDDEEFIYDLYYTHESGCDGSMFPLHPLDENIMYRTDCNHSFSNCEESDSNDESHWKNDYPDEDLFYSSEEENSISDNFSNSSYDSDDNNYTSRKLFWNSNTDDRDELYNFEVYNEDEDEDEL